MTIGERIKERRKELGLSQQELADRIGVTSRTSVCTVEKDREDLTLERLRRYADALGVTPSYLMGWDNVDVPCEMPFKIDLSTEDVQIVKALGKLSQNGREKVKERIKELLILEGKL